MIRAYGVASSAIDQQMRRFERSAARVATAEPAPDYVRETVEQLGARHAVSANLSVLRAADDMTGTLISIFA